jgi:hypothetical protein
MQTFSHLLKKYLCYICSIYSDICLEELNKIKENLKQYCLSPGRDLNLGPAPNVTVLTTRNARVHTVTNTKFNLFWVFYLFTRRFNCWRLLRHFFYYYFLIEECAAVAMVEVHTKVLIVIQVFEIWWRIDWFIVNRRYWFCCFHCLHPKRPRQIFRILVP